MGRVLRQSSVNLLVTLAGFGIGGINVLFLYTHILQPDYYGLVTFVLAFSTILMPLMSMGMHNALLRFYSQLDREEDRDRLTSFALIFPLCLSLVWAMALLIGYDPAAGILTTRNPIVGDYLWYIFLLGLFMAYFELGHAYAKVHLESVLGNTLKEVFVRLGVTALLVMVYLGKLDDRGFLTAMLWLYALRSVLMWAGALRLRKLSLSFRVPENYREIMLYGLLMLLGSSASIVILEIDKVMLNSFRLIEEVAFYGVAVYISTVVAMPYRAMYHISAPLSASQINLKQFDALKLLYQSSSLSLYTISGGIFFLIMGNLVDLYSFLPEHFGAFYPVVFLVALAKLSDSLSGTANSILFYSQYYTYMLLMGIGLAILTITLNYLLIPIYGAVGCAMATLTSVLLYNIVKVWFIQARFGFLPFRRHTLIATLAIGLLTLLGVFLPMPDGWSPVFRIIIRSGLLSMIYASSIYYLGYSPEVKSAITAYLTRFIQLKKKSHDPEGPRDSNN